MYPQSVQETKEKLGVQGTPISRTQEEIIARMKASNGLFSFDLEVLVDYLDFDHAKEYLYQSLNAEDWDEIRKETYYNAQPHLKDVDVKKWERIKHLNFNKVKDSFLRSTVTKREWDEARAPQTVEFATEQARSCMEFAWDKANDKRGISAARSVQKLEAWMWLIGKDELVEFINDDGNYAPYGKPILEKICEEMGWPNADNGCRDME